MSNKIILKKSVVDARIPTTDDLAYGELAINYNNGKLFYKKSDGVDSNNDIIDSFPSQSLLSQSFTTTDLNTTSLSVETIDLSPITHPPHQLGRLFYDQTHGALNIWLDNDTLPQELGQQHWVRVYNNTGSDIDAGKPVYYTGVFNGTPTIEMADATNPMAFNITGLTTHGVLNNSYGYVTTVGVVRNINTAHLQANNRVFLGLTPGATQNASPTYPNYPMCIGYVLISDATNGAIIVEQQNHSVKSFRVVTDAHIGGDLTVSGNLSILGNQSTVTLTNLSVDTSFVYSNSGDTIGQSNTTFTGTGNNDAYFVGHYTGTTTETYYVRIDSVGGGTGGVDTIEWSYVSDFSVIEASGIDLSLTDIVLDAPYNVQIRFATTTGHTLNDVWQGTAGPINIDVGFASNRNTGTSGVGYTHVGAFFDVTDIKWKFFDEYLPEPEGDIDTNHATFHLATVAASIFEGNLTGDVTGNLTGDVTGNLTGDVTGNVTGTSASWAAPIQLTLAGGTTGSVSFNGSSNVTLTSTLNTTDINTHLASGNVGNIVCLDLSASNVDITGDLNVLGTTTTVNQTTLTVSDSKIFLAEGNPSDAIDIALVFQYNDGVNDLSGGIFRDASNEYITFFKDYDPVIVNNIDTTDPTYALATIKAAEFIGDVNWSNVTNRDDILLNSLTVGDLTVTGTTTTNNVSTVSSDSPLIILNQTPTANIDVGIVGQYDIAGTAYGAGLFRDATDGRFKLFTGSQQTFTDSASIDTSATGYSLAILEADQFIGNVAWSNITGRPQSTNDIVEGPNNLYYTDTRARLAISVTDSGGDGSLSYDNTSGVITYTGPSATDVRAHFSGGTGVTITDGSIAIGQAVSTTSDVTFNNVTVNELRGPAELIIDPAGVGDNTGKVIIKGDLQIDGTTTTINSTTISIDDKNLVLAADAADGSVADGAGITINGASATFNYAHIGTKWQANKSIETNSQLISTVAIGTAPLAVTSTTLVSNLNADLLDGQEGSYYLNWGNFTNTPNLLGSIEVTDTDTDYTWAETGTITADTTADTVKLVSGNDINIDADTTNDAIRIKHVDITRTNNTSTASPAHGGSFDVIDSITSSARGHITAVNTKTVTLPNPGTYLSSQNNLVTGLDYGSHVVFSQADTYTPTNVTTDEVVKQIAFLYTQGFLSFEITVSMSRLSSVSASREVYMTKILAIYNSEFDTVYTTEYATMSNVSVPTVAVTVDYDELGIYVNIVNKDINETNAISTNTHIVAHKI